MKLSYIDSGNKLFKIYLRTLIRVNAHKMVGT